jgi:uncharacterized protein (TIGR02270 family)
MIREYIRPLPIEDILEEHSEEAAFMYESRCRCLVDPESSWLDLAGYEQRMEPHLHGLALGGFATAKLLNDKLTLEEDEEPGEAFVAAIVYTMLEWIEPMQWLIDALGQKPPHFHAIVDGLKCSKAPDLEGWLEYFTEHEEPNVRAVGATVIGYRRANALKEKLYSLRDDPDQQVSMAAIYSLAEMGVMPDKNALVPLFHSTDPANVVTAIELLLRMGASEAVNLCRDKCTASAPEISQKLVFYLAICGSVDDIQIINKLITEQPFSKKDCLLALGLCGNPNSVEVLIDYLGSIEDYDLFMAACQGLRLITGIDYIPQLDPDEVEQKQIIEYQNFWRNWWHNNRSNFASNLKWRRGQMLSPAVLYNELLRPGNPCRHMTYLEMVIRYGCTVDFQYDQAYDIQVRQLHGLHGWAKQQNNLFNQGVSYYNGKPLA